MDTGGFFAEPSNGGTGVGGGLDFMDVGGGFDAGQSDTPFQPGAVGGQEFDHENEPPLMEELGINLDSIKLKTKMVLNPMSGGNSAILADADMAGPILFVLLFAAALLAAGKSQFGYIYGVGTTGSLSLYGVLNFMSQEKRLTLGGTVGILGYALLPLVILSLISIFVSLSSVHGMVMVAISVAWCTAAATKLFVAVLQSVDQKLLIGYPVGLFYSVFALLAVF